jgi:hypothetical protein
VKLVDQWRTIEDRLPADWVDARLDVTPETASERPRAAGLLGPANPGRVGDALRVTVRRGAGTGALGPEGIRRLFSRMDEARVWSSLSLVDVEEAPPAEDAPQASLVDRWMAAAAGLPPDWSDVHAELRLRSSDDLPRAALLCAPLNPTHVEGTAFWFRAARRAGYGASPEMVHRCLARLDGGEIRGDVKVLRVLCETGHVATQGPVFRVGGRYV